MAAHPGSFAEHIAPGLRAIVGTRIERWEMTYSRCTRVETTKRYYEDWLHAAGLPVAQSRDVGEGTPFYDPLEGSTKRLTPEGFSIGFEIYKELWDTDLYKGAGSALRDAAQGLADAMAERVEIEAADPFNSGFASYSTIDGGSYLFASDHARLDGGTNQSNVGSGVALSYANILSALPKFRKWVSDRGYKLNYQPNLLVIPPDLEYTVREMLESDTDPDNANFAANVIPGRIKYVINPWLTDTNAWFLIDTAHNPIITLWRERPTFDAYDDKNTRAAKFASHMWFTVSPVHWIGAYGDPGAS